MKKSLAQLCLALLSGMLLGISFPESRLWLCAWIALVPLFIALAGCGWKRALLLSWASGFCFFGIIFQWSLLFGFSVWLALCLMFGLCTGICGAITAPFLNSDSSAVRITYPALVWVSIEYIRSFGFLGMNWGSISYSQFTFLPLIQIVSITGMYGVTLMIVLFNSALRELLMKAAFRRRTAEESDRTGQLSMISIVIAVALPLMSICWGCCRLSSDRSKESLYPRVRISAVQPSLDMCLQRDASVQRMSLSTLEKLTSRGQAEGGALFLWPESSMLTYFPNDEQVKERICNFTARRGIYLLAGAPYMGSDSHIYNEAFLISPKGGVVEGYAKRRLVPFSENLPFSRYLRKYHPFNRFSDVKPGNAWKTFVTPMARFGALICFENDFPYIARLNIRKGAQFLAVLANDAWFERTSAAAHHLSWGVFRAVENHSNLVQSANTGISAFIDYNGRIRSSTELYARTVLTDDIILEPAGTPYTRAGDWLPIMCLIAASATWIAAALRKTV
jgi:apolipoprotein N-acyltransferase